MAVNICVHLFFLIKSTVTDIGAKCKKRAAKKRSKQVKDQPEDKASAQKEQIDKPEEEHD